MYQFRGPYQFSKASRAFEIQKTKHGHDHQNVYKKLLCIYKCESNLWPQFARVSIFQLMSLKGCFSDQEAVQCVLFCGGVHDHVHNV